MMVTWTGIVTVDLGKMDEFGLYFGGIADKSCSSIVCDRQKEE